MGLQTTLKALADPVRRQILDLLKNGRLSAGEISAHFPVTAPSISRHLSVLKEADLIRDQRGRKIHLLRTKYVGVGRNYVVDYRFERRIRP